MKANYCIFMHTNEMITYINVLALRNQLTNTYQFQKIEERKSFNGDLYGRPLKYL
jgi:hypothetical protein